MCDLLLVIILHSRPIVYSLLTVDNVDWIVWWWWCDASLSDLFEKSLENGDLSASCVWQTLEKCGEKRSSALLTDPVSVMNPEAGGQSTMKRFRGCIQFQQKVHFCSYQCPACDCHLRGKKCLLFQMYFEITQPPLTTDKNLVKFLYGSFSVFEASVHIWSSLMVRPTPTSIITLQICPNISLSRALLISHWCS